LVLVSVLSQWQPAVSMRSEVAEAATPPPGASKALPIVGAGIPAGAPSGGAGVLGGGAALAGLRDEKAASAADRAADSHLGSVNAVPTSVVPQITIAVGRLPVTNLPATNLPIAGGGGGGVGADGQKSDRAGLDKAALERVSFGSEAGNRATSDRVALDWKALAVGLRVEPLTGVPLPAAKGDAADDSSSGATAYLVEGAKADLTAFLRRLGEAAQTRGWDVRNGEADAQSVTAMVPAAPATPSYVEGEPERVSDKTKSKQPAPGADPFVRLVVVVRSQPR
jgi:hypothetical protein